MTKCEAGLAPTAVNSFEGLECAGASRSTACMFGVRSYKRATLSPHDPWLPRRVLGREGQLRCLLLSRGHESWSRGPLPVRAPEPAPADTRTASAWGHGWRQTKSPGWLVARASHRDRVRVGERPA